MNQHPRKVYLRKKGKTFIFESKVKGQTKYLWTIPQPYENFLRELCKSSFFTREKAKKIMTLLVSADYKDVYPTKQPPEVRTTNIVGSSENDDLDDLNELKERI